jgi:hypothetical protein
VVFTDPDTVREVIHNFNRHGFDSLYPRYAGGRPQTFTLPKRQEIKRIALSEPQDLDQPFATWSLSKLADYHGVSFNTTGPTGCDEKFLSEKLASVQADQQRIGSIIEERTALSAEDVGAPVP